MATRAGADTGTGRIRTRLASSRLIGRSAELAELEAALAEAADGRPSLAFVAGESGIGKTRLLAELERRAREGGALVLSGDAIDLGGDSDLPYLPLVAALRPLARAGHPALTEPVREAIAPLLPGLGVDAPQLRWAGDPGAQAQLFEGLLSLLDALGQERPVLLVIDYLHWADGSTRAALTFRARNRTAEHVVSRGQLPRTGRARHDRVRKPGGVPARLRRRRVPRHLGISGGDRRLGAPWPGLCAGRGGRRRP